MLYVIRYFVVGITNTRVPRKLRRQQRRHTYKLYRIIFMVYGSFLYILGRCSQDSASTRTRVNLGSTRVSMTLIYPPDLPTSQHTKENGCACTYLLRDAECAANGIVSPSSPKNDHRSLYIFLADIFRALDRPRFTNESLDGYLSSPVHYPVPEVGPGIEFDP